MSTQLILTPLTSAVRNTVGKGNEQTLKNQNRLASDVVLREYCNKYYLQLLSIIAEKVHKEKAQQDKLKEVKACLNFKVCLGKSSKIQEVSQHSESRTPDVRGDLRRRLRSRRSHSMSRSLEPTPDVFSRIRRDISESHINRLGIKEERKEVCSKGWRVWFDDLPSESVNSYDDLKKEFLANFLQQKKCIKDLMEIHHIRQRKGKSTEYFE
nr:reverse transcriptase domain-containing protein [Tanacetum cinerariifolium]